MNASRGDQRAFRELFDHYWDRIYANALHFLKSPDLARELAQEVFIRVWMKKEKLVGVQQFEPWLYRVARNIFLDHLRQRLITTSLQDLDRLELNEGEPSAQGRMELQELQTLINDAIAHLPAQMQKAFTLSRLHGFTHGQIAREMNISKATSQNYIARSLVLIRKQLLHYLGMFL
ncbi:MAG TPA: sigma-70 family RNA polymerase sigma factor [Puia sp.]|jgi:RNA polymerase sigma-70 factor (ECF subfamily)